MRLGKVTTERGMGRDPTESTRFSRFLHCYLPILRVQSEFLIGSRFLRELKRHLNTRETDALQERGLDDVDHGKTGVK